MQNVPNPWREITKKNQEQQIQTSVYSYRETATAKGRVLISYVRSNSESRYTTSE